MFRKSGQYGVPVIDVDGEIIIGFDRKRLKEVLKIE
jgi:glutaredoxin 3